MLGLKEMWISRRINWWSWYPATLKLSWSFRRKHILDLLSLFYKSKGLSLSFNASYLLNTSAWTPKIKWTPREFIRLFKVVKYDVIYEAYFVQIAAFGWKGFSQTNNNSRTLALCITYTFLKFDLWLVVKPSQNIFELIMFSYVVPLAWDPYYSSMSRNSHLPSTERHTVCWLK